MQKNLHIFRILAELSEEQIQEYADEEGCVSLLGVDIEADYDLDWKKAGDDVVAFFYAGCSDDAEDLKSHIQDYLEDDDIKIISIKKAICNLSKIDKDWLPEDIDEYSNDFFFPFSCLLFSPIYLSPEYLKMFDAELIPFFYKD